MFTFLPETAVLYGFLYSLMTLIQIKYLLMLFKFNSLKFNSRKILLVFESFVNRNTKFKYPCFFMFLDFIKISSYVCIPVPTHYALSNKQSQLNQCVDCRECVLCSLCTPVRRVRLYSIVNVYCCELIFVNVIVIC